MISIITSQVDVAHTVQSISQQFPVKSFDLSFPLALLYQRQGKRNLKPGILYAKFLSQLGAKSE